MNRDPKHDEKIEQQSDSKPASVDYLLEPADFKKFIPGRSKEETLKDVQWRGNFEMATNLNQKEACAISFGFFGGPFSEDPRGTNTILWAIFVDDKFQKFVQWPKWNEQPEKLGAFPSLMQAVEGGPVNIFELENKDVKPTAPSQTDPGLTAAWLLFGRGVMAGRKGIEKKNAQLRDQYNASRLKLGMTDGEVESVLKSKPIESGDFQGGAWQIYGTTESLDILKYLHYSNILILFNSGKVTGIYSGSTIPGGKDGIRSLREPVRTEGQMQRPSFADLPAARD